MAFRHTDDRLGVGTQTHTRTHATQTIEIWKPLPSQTHTLAHILRAMNGECGAHTLETTFLPFATAVFCLMNGRINFWRHKNNRRTAANFCMSGGQRNGTVNTLRVLNAVYYGLRRFDTIRQRWLEMVKWWVCCVCVFGIISRCGRLNVNQQQKKIQCATRPHAFTVLVHVHIL